MHLEDDWMSLQTHTWATGCLWTRSQFDFEGLFFCSNSGLNLYENEGTNDNKDEHGPLETFGDEGAYK